MTARCFSPILVGLTLACPNNLTSMAQAAETDQRYSAGWRDGTTVAGSEVADWHEQNAHPHLSGRRLFDEANPCRRLIDRSHSPALPPSVFVEFFGGDRLPGRVLGFQNGAESPYHRLPAHLLLEPGIELHWPDRGEHTVVRVSTEWLRRVVWQRRGDDAYQPSTVFLRDGREVAFRSLRWSQSAVTLLTESGIESAAFDDIAEVHLPRRDAWDVYFEQLAALTPDCSSRLIQIETSDGLRATTSRERFQAAHRGDRSIPENWLQLVQPAWSLDPFWIRYRTIRTWRFFAAHEVPLTLIAPDEVRQESVFGSAWRWQVDRNVQGGPLVSGGDEFGWGLGVHAFNELRFELPAVARSFRTRLGLDKIADTGGCVRCIVSAGRNREHKLYESRLLIGSQDVLDTGDVHLPGSADEPKWLTLTVDPAHEGRPPGADPFDIRDSLDWLEPEVRLDADGVQQEVARRAFGRIPAFGDWTWDADESGPRLINHWDTSDSHDPRYAHWAAADQNAFFLLRRRFSVQADDRYLALVVSRLRDATTPAIVQVRIDGRAVGEFAVPARHVGEIPDPVLVPIDGYRGRSIECELFQIAEGERSFVDWQGMAVVSRRPGLVQIFEDSAQFVTDLDEGGGGASLVRDDVHSGTAALRISPPARGNARLQGLDAAIRNRPRIGEYRYLRFAWKKSGGGTIGLQFEHPGRRGTNGDRGAAIMHRSRTRLDERGKLRGYRFTAGRGATDDQPAVQLDRNPPADWSVVTRDLFGDLGDFTLTGLSFSCPDGDFALFDHIYLARTQQDFSSIPELLAAAADDDPPAQTDENVVRQAVGLWEYGPVLTEVAPQFSTSASGAGVWLLKEHAGRNNVVRTHPPTGSEPCILRAPIAPVKGKQTHLALTVGHDPDGEWRLLVQADGQTLHDALIGKQSAPDGWADVTVDLSKFAGRPIVVEVHNHPHGGSHQAAYWNRLVIEER
jgi:hypothetical protein